MPAPTLVPHWMMVGGRRFQILAAPGREPVLEDGTDPERIPYWSVIWDSAPALASWLTRTPDVCRSPILELGCGTGLVGMTAAALGAAVTQTDLFPEAVTAARRTAAVNGVSGIRHAAADWRHWPLHGRWPVILGADLLYERATHEALLQVMQQALSPDGTVYLADPGRPMSEAFLTRVQQSGWRATETDLGLHGESSITLWALRRMAAPR